jgi:DNA repair protein RadA/Sms
MAVGIDQNRLSLLLAVLEKRAGLALAGDDVYVNIAGGMSIEEPAADLGIVAAVASSVRNRPLAPSTALFGEVGLSGEIRGIPQAGLRVREAAQMGFTRIVMPAANVDPADAALAAGPQPAGDGARPELVGVRTVGEAFDLLM